MRPAFFISIIVALGLVLVPGLWVLVVTVLSGISHKLRAIPFIATGYLKGRRKSGFVSIIGLVSIYAISASSCHVVTVLSIMGGFGEDLKKKILGAKAHIIVDNPEGLVLNEERVIEIVKKTDGVVGAYSFIEGEIMLKSSLNITGGVLRGIEVDEAVKVMNLSEIIEEGQLSYIKHPEKLVAHIYPEPKVFTSPLEVLSKNEPGQKTEKTTQPIFQDKSPSIGKGKDGKSQNKNKINDEASAPDKGQPSITPNTKMVPPAVIIGREMEKTLGVFIGEEVKLISPLGEIGPTGPIPRIRVFRVGSVFFSGMYEYDAKNVYVSLESARQFLGIDRGVSGIEVKVKKPQRVERVAMLIKNRVKKAGFKLRVRNWKELNRSLFSALLLEKIAMFLMLSLTILIASFSIISTLTMMVMERTNEIAVLKTLGAGDGMLTKIFQFQGMLIGAIGTFVGICLGILLCFFISRFGIPINPEVHYINRLPVKMDWIEIALVGVFSLIICSVITIYPARMAAKLPVIDGLRNR